MQSNLAYQYEDERPSEIIGGKVVMMAGATVKHNHISGNIFSIFHRYLKGKKCIPFGDGTKLFLDEDNQFIPDGMIVCDKDKVKEDGVYGAPDLVVEVLSHSTAKNDRGKKKDAYERVGVGEYWIVDPANKTVEVYLLKEERFVLDNTYSIYPDFIFDHLLTEAERAAIPESFKCSLFDDLEIRLEDVFDRV